MRSDPNGFFEFAGIGSNPFLIGIIASLLCSAGVIIYAKSIEANPNRRALQMPRRANRIESSDNRNVMMAAMCAVIVSVVVLSWTGSIVITTPFAVMAAAVSWTHFRNRERRQGEAMLQVWPEVTDHLISAIHSGLSLTEALVGLETRGPELVRPYFLAFHDELLSNGNFIECAERLKVRLNTHGSDQILESIMMAKSLGGSELLQIFRTLGDFLRQDLALRKEIDIKHGWIKNSAHLSAAAPWLLLLLLSGQPGTASAFAQPGGVMILIFGLFLTGVAYLWMAKLGKLPAPARVFG